MSNCLYNVRAKCDAKRRQGEREIARAAKIRTDAEEKIRQADQDLADYFLQPALPEWEKVKRALDSGKLDHAQLDKLDDELWHLRSSDIRTLANSFRKRGDQDMAAKLDVRDLEIAQWLSTYLRPRLAEMKREEEERARKEAAFDKMLDAAKSA